MTTVSNVVSDRLTLKLSMPFLVGAGYSGEANRVFSGNVYNVRVYTRALSDVEVSNNFKIDNARFSIS